jgi:hypothetical protein
MSVNRENVTWQNEQGLWRNAFYPVSYLNETSEDFDYEWDVEYDYRSLTRVSETWRTSELAFERNTSGMANPGGTQLIPFTPENLKRITELESYREAYEVRRQEARKAQREREGW